MGVWIETNWEAMQKFVNMSHPAWVCGLKHPNNDSYVSIRGSHPAWVCGLKLINGVTGYFKCVTPCVGVWIETGQTYVWNADYRSHPAWVCGLKPSWEAARAARPVTPCVGVWIETENN